jgi:amidase
VPGTNEIAYLELTEVAELIRSRQITSVEVTETILSRIEAYDPTLKSYVTVMSDRALEAARVADDEIARGRYRGPLHGVPVAVKDLAYTADAPTGSGSTIFANYLSPYDATVVSRLRSAGAVLTGKVRMTEGAYTDHHPDLPVPVNPWDANTWAGVSSSGSGVATAAGLAYGTLGSDTGGSIRLPSSMNGITGLKPTWGRVSRYGITELAASLDHIGPMARSAADCAAILGVIAGADVNDPTAALEPVPNYLADLGLTRSPRVGIDPAVIATFDTETQAMLAEVVSILEGLGWVVTNVASPGLHTSAADFEALCAVETAHAHLDTYPSRAAEYGPALSRLIDLGRSMSAIDYQKLMEARRAFTGRMNRMFEDIDLFLLPGIGAASPTLEQVSTFGSDPNLLAAILTPTAPLDHSGHPTITLPGGFTDRGTPLALQFVGGQFKEQLLLQSAHAFQSVTAFHRVHPTLVPAAEAQLEGTLS